MSHLTTLKLIGEIFGGFCVAITSIATTAYGYIRLRMARDLHELKKKKLEQEIERNRLNLAELHHRVIVLSIVEALKIFQEDGKGKTLLHTNGGKLGTLLLIWAYLCAQTKDYWNSGIQVALFVLGIIALQICWNLTRNFASEIIDLRSESRAIRDASEATAAQ